MIEHLEKAKEYQLGLQHPDGYWWYTLEANESICAEAIFLMHFLGEVDHEVEAGLARRILSTQREDGTWALYYGGPPDLSTTIECYWALKLVSQNQIPPVPPFLKGGDRTVPPFAKGGERGFDSHLNRARDYILSSGGITRARVFTKIHLAQFGLAPWNACPAMPPELMLFPSWFPISVYEFSSWARACIIPLLVVFNKKPIRPLLPPHPTPPPRGGRKREGVVFNLNELFVEPPDKRDWSFKVNKPLFSWERFFIGLDKILKITTRMPFCPFDRPAIKKCEEWICEHIAKTEDIFPALAYGAIALSSLGHPNSHPIIRKALNALKSFQQVYEGDDLPAIVCHGDCHAASRLAMTYQQCCISPVWDTPWQITALLEAGTPPDHPALLKAGRWLLSKEITKTRGDWKFKNPRAEASGWSFEFENEYFPDVDDTIQVLHVLNRLALSETEKRPAIERGMAWLLSMQNDDGGWGAFDKNQRLVIVNRIPFSDHGACLDPSSPDITGRMLGLLADSFILSLSKDEIDSPFDKLRVSEVISRALSYLSRTQEPFGGWFGRWGVNYIYGTWCVLAGLLDSHFRGNDMPQRIKKAADWLISIQHEDGGWSESPESYKLGKYEPYPRNAMPPHPTPPPRGGREREGVVRKSIGVPSQTAWAVMGLMAAISHAQLRSGDCHAASRLAMTKGIEFLINNQNENGTWDEREFTGTGFPGHFYIRYHGYRHFFPLMALARFSSFSK